MIKEAIDPFGNRFKSIAEMCRHYKIGTSTYRGRLNKGWTQEEALGIVDKTEYIKDPCGNKFKNILEMCAHYKIKYDTYNTRLNAGWTQEEALGISSRKEYIIDPFGNKFKTIREMCMHYKMNYGLCKWRMKSKYDKVLCIADTDKFRIYLGFIGIDGRAYYYINNRKDKYYTVGEILKMCNSSLLEDYLKIHPDEKYDPYDL